jgi:ABC-type Fe3+ transport system permease subunit
MPDDLERGARSQTVVEAVQRDTGRSGRARARRRYRKARAKQHAIVALALVVAAAIIAVLVLAGFWIAHWVAERERCFGTSPTVCRALRWSDEQECRAGEGCGRPVEREPR